MESRALVRNFQISAVTRLHEALHDLNLVKAWKVLNESYCLCYEMHAPYMIFSVIEGYIKTHLM